MKSSFIPKYERKIVKISDLTTQGRNSDNFSFVFWEKRWLHKFILKLSDLYKDSQNLGRPRLYILPISTQRFCLPDPTTIAEITNPNFHAFLDPETIWFDKKIREIQVS